VPVSHCQSSFLAFPPPPLLFRVCTRFISIYSSSFVADQFSPQVARPCETHRGGGCPHRSSPEAASPHPSATTHTHPPAGRPPNPAPPPSQCSCLVWPARCRPSPTVSSESGSDFATCHERAGRVIRGQSGRFNQCRRCCSTAKRGRNPASKWRHCEQWDKCRPGQWRTRRSWKYRDSRRRHARSCRRGKTGRQGGHGLSAASGIALC
jgi:hypothetical protein